MGRMTSHIWNGSHNPRETSNQNIIIPGFLDKATRSAPGGPGGPLGPRGTETPWRPRDVSWCLWYLLHLDLFCWAILQGRQGQWQGGERRCVSQEKSSGCVWKVGKSPENLTCLYHVFQDFPIFRIAISEKKHFQTKPSSKSTTTSIALGKWIWSTNDIAWRSHTATVQKMWSIFFDRPQQKCVKT